jgi:hypothetical protein
MPIPVLRRYEIARHVASTISPKTKPTIPNATPSKAAIDASR